MAVGCCMSRVNREEKKVFCLSQTKPNKVQLIVCYYSITATSEALRVPFYFVPVNAEFRIKLHQQQPVAFLFFLVHTFLKRRARAIFSEFFPHIKESPPENTGGGGKKFAQESKQSYRGTWQKLPQCNLNCALFPLKDRSLMWFLCELDYFIVLPRRLLLSATLCCE